MFCQKYADSISFRPPNHDYFISGHWELRIDKNIFGLAVWGKNRDIFQSTTITQNAICGMRIVLPGHCKLSRIDQNSQVLPHPKSSILTLYLNWGCHNLTGFRWLGLLCGTLLKKKMYVYKSQLAYK